MIGIAWKGFGACLALLTLPGTLELLIVTILSIRKPRRSAPVSCATAFRVAVIVPAHNEELNIARCVRSLLPPGHCVAPENVIVIADNCADQTARHAVAAGARVLVRDDPGRRGKGFALDYAFGKLAPEGWDAFAVVDADSEVAPNFLEELTAALRGGAAAAQCRYLVRNAGESVHTRLMNIALFAFNVLRPRARERAGLSAGIYGNGFALSAETLRSVPYAATSVVEDLEYHLALVRAGKRVAFVDATAVYGDMPVAGPGVDTQRARWEGGRFRMIKDKAPGLLRDVLRGDWRLAEPCLDLLLLPLAFHVSLLLLAAATPFWPVRAIAFGGLAVVALHLVTAVRLMGGGFRDFAILFSAPLYVLWKILLIPKLVRSARSGSAWIRTERAAYRNAP